MACLAGLCVPPQSSEQASNVQQPPGPVRQQNPLPEGRTDKSTLNLSPSASQSDLTQMGSTAVFFMFLISI